MLEELYNYIAYSMLEEPFWPIVCYIAKFPFHEILRYLFHKNVYILGLGDSENFTVMTVLHDY